MTPINISSNELLYRNSNIPKLKSKIVLSNQIQNNHKKQKVSGPTQSSGTTYFFDGQ